MCARKTAVLKRGTTKLKPCSCARFVAKLERWSFFRSLEPIYAKINSFFHHFQHHFFLSCPDVEKNGRLVLQGRAQARAAHRPRRAQVDVVRARLGRAPAPPRRWRAAAATVWRARPRGRLEQPAEPVQLARPAQPVQLGRFAVCVFLVSSFLM